MSFLEGELTRPYGAKVCLAVDCAFSLANFGVLGELAHSWGKMFMVLTALSPQIRLAGAAFGLPNPDAVELADAASPAVVSAAAHVLGFIMMTLLHGQVVSMQIVHHKESEGFADGTFCIEHSSFALALLRMASLAVAPAALIPPIVTA